MWKAQSDCSHLLKGSNGRSKCVRPERLLEITKLTGFVLMERLIWVLYECSRSCTNVSQSPWCLASNEAVKQSEIYCLFLAHPFVWGWTAMVGRCFKLWKLQWVSKFSSRNSGPSSVRRKEIIAQGVIHWSLRMHLTCPLLVVQVDVAGVHFK